MILKQIKVLEIAGLAPAPYCGMILADFGANVIRIDKTGNQPDVDVLSHGKKSVSLNLKEPKGIEILRKLCKSSDVLIEPFRKGVMENLGIGPEVLLKDNPRLIYARLTGYGQTGSYSHKAGHDVNYIALSGLLSMFGRNNENPLFPLNVVADFGGGGLMCALGIILALYERNSSDLGQVVDSSMVKGAAYLGSWLYRSQNLPVWGRERGNNFIDTGAHFYEVYKTKDGKYVSVGAIEPKFYMELLKGLNTPYDEAPQLGDTDTLKALFTRKFLERTREEWCEVFKDLDACFAPVLELNEAVKYPHNVEQKTFVKNEDDEIYAPNPGPVLSRTPGMTRAVEKRPNFGEHTIEVLRQIGISNADINELENAGVIECYKNSKL